MPKSTPYFTLPVFKELDLDWFARYATGCGDTRRAFKEWTNFVSSPHPPSNDAKFRKVLRLALAVSAATVSHYIYRQRFPAAWAMDPNRRLGADIIRSMDAISNTLGMTPAVATPPAARAASRKGVRRIALLAELDGVPSPRFHLTVLAAMVRAAELNRNFAVEIHEVRPSDSDLKDRIARVIRNSSPDGVVWFRLTPDAACLDTISDAGGLPVVLVHAARLRYPAPVIAHIVPGQRSIKSGVALWARRLPPSPKKSKTVVVGAMRPDAPQTTPFAPADPAVPVSIRAERVDLIVAGIEAAGLKPALVWVDDYSASQAYKLISAHPEAKGYFGLSDEIAVAASQLLMAQGKDATRRVVGFDGSELAGRLRLPSFDQRLPKLGETVVAQFEDWFRDPVWSGCKEIEVGLILRDVSKSGRASGQSTPRRTARI